jgi:hypothetical protein
MKIAVLTGLVLLAGCAGGGSTGSAAIPAPHNGALAPSAVTPISGTSPAASLTDPNPQMLKTVASATTPLLAPGNYDIVVTWTASATNAVLGIGLPPAVELNRNAGQVSIVDSRWAIVASGIGTATYHITTAVGPVGALETGMRSFDLVISQTGVANQTASVQPGTYQIVVTQI